MNKLVLHPTLSLDPSLLLFLESEIFELQVIEIAFNDKIEPMKDEPKSLFNLFPDTTSAEDPDLDIAQKIINLNTLEIQLKELFRVMENFMKQRLEFSATLDEFGQGFTTMAK